MTVGEKSISKDQVKSHNVFTLRYFLAKKSFERDLVKRVSLLTLETLPPEERAVLERILQHMEHYFAVDAEFEGALKQILDGENAPDSRDVYQCYWKDRALAAENQLASLAQVLPNGE